MKNLVLLSIIGLFSFGVFIWLVREHRGCMKARIVPTFLEYGREARAFMEEPNPFNCERYLNARLQYLRSVDCCPENILYLNRTTYEQLISNLEGQRGRCGAVNGKS